MTVHQFRHLAGYFYLEDNPEDTETVRALLGHAWSKTTRIYVGSESRRAGKVIQPLRSTKTRGTKAQAEAATQTHAQQEEG